MPVLTTTLDNLEAIATQTTLLSEEQLNHCSHYLDAVDAELVADTGLAYFLKALVHQYLVHMVSSKPAFNWSHDGAVQDALNKVRDQQTAPAGRNLRLHLVFDQSSQF